MVAYDIIATGSKGNAVVIDNRILIDCGVPFKALKGHYEGLTLVLLTHLHSDHFNRSTVRKLAQERPTIRWACCPWLVTPLLECSVSKSKIDVADIGEGICYGDITIEPVPLVHNVPNAGWKIFLPDSKIICATDTNSMEGITAKGYDLYLLAASYTADGIVERIKRKEEAGEYCYEWDVLHNHLSAEKAEKWLYENMDMNSRYVCLHGHEGEEEKE